MHDRLSLNPRHRHQLHIAVAPYVLQNRQTRRTASPSQFTRGGRADTPGRPHAVLPSRFTPASTRFRPGFYPLSPHFRPGFAPVFSPIKAPNHSKTASTHQNAASPRHQQTFSPSRISISPIPTACAFASVSICAILRPSAPSASRSADEPSCAVKQVGRSLPAVAGGSAPPCLSPGRLHAATQTPPMGELR